MKSGRGGQAVRRDFGMVGSVRALEVTYSDINGWHPHIHELVFLPTEVDAKADAKVARQAWEAAAAAEGLDMNWHGFDWSDTNARVAEYVAKYGHEPHWQESNELTKWHVKRGREDHVTPLGAAAARRRW